MQITPPPTTLNENFRQTSTNAVATHIDAEHPTIEHHVKPLLRELFGAEAQPINILVAKNIVSFGLQSQTVSRLIAHIKNGNPHLAYQNDPWRANLLEGDPSQRIQHHQAAIQRCKSPAVFDHQAISIDLRKAGWKGKLVLIGQIEAGHRALIEIGQQPFRLELRNGNLVYRDHLKKPIDAKSLVAKLQQIKRITKTTSVLRCRLQPKRNAGSQNRSLPIGARFTPVLASDPLATMLGQMLKQHFLPTASASDIKQVGASTQLRFWLEDQHDQPLIANIGPRAYLTYQFDPWQVNLLQGADETNRAEDALAARHRAESPALYAENFNRLRNEFAPYQNAKRPMIISGQIESANRVLVQIANVETEVYLINDELRYGSDKQSLKAFIDDLEPTSPEDRATPAKKPSNHTPNRPVQLAPPSDDHLIQPELLSDATTWLQRSSKKFRDADSSRIGEEIHAFLERHGLQNEIGAPNEVQNFKTWASFNTTLHPERLLVNLDLSRPHLGFTLDPWQANHLNQINATETSAAKTRCRNPEVFASLQPIIEAVETAKVTVHDTILEGQVKDTDQLQIMFNGISTVVRFRNGKYQFSVDNKFVSAKGFANHLNSKQPLLQRLYAKLAHEAKLRGAKLETVIGEKFETTPASTKDGLYGLIELALKQQQANNIELFKELLEEGHDRTVIMLAGLTRAVDAMCAVASQDHKTLIATLQAQAKANSEELASLETADAARQTQHTELQRGYYEDILTTLRELHMATPAPQSLFGKIGLTKTRGPKP